VSEIAGNFDMRALRLCLMGLAATTAVLAFNPATAQMKLAPKSATPAGPETRYFTSIDGLMDGNADVVLKEIRQGKTVTSATLDGTAQTQIDKLPVAVKLTRRPTGDTFEFKGQIVVGQTSNDVTSSDNSDQSEKEFQENQSADDNIVAAPKDFTEVSPEAIAVRIKIEAALDFVKTLRGQNAEVSLSSLGVACDSLRSGEQVLVLAVDPERAAAFVAKAKTYPGVVSAGWTSGVVDMERTIRFAAADWRDGDKLNRDKIASAVAGVLAKPLSAKLATTRWSDDTGKLKLTFKRPSSTLPALELTETIEVTVLVAADKPGTSDRLMLWMSAPSVATADESTGARLNLADAASSDEESDPRDDNGAVAALATSFKAQRWDSDKSDWK
jgi:hypothetical protein